ncbi:MAG: cytochrome c [Kiloniellales bacterium]|nr:cytochrome c [Kiloniellales bacterium]
MLIAGSVLLVAFASSVNADLADDKPADVVMYRQLLMKSLDVHMAGIAVLVENKVDYWGHARAHAEAIEGISRDMPMVFPHWTGPEATETLALSTVWKDWQVFRSSSSELTQQAALLVEATGSIDRRAIQLQYQKVREACDGCHEAFMKPD